MDARRAPLSCAQGRLWFIDQLAGGESTEYNVPMVLALRGPLDLDVLARALQTIVDRHEILRTRFEAPRGDPEQVIAPHLALTLPCTDLRDAGEPEQRAALDAALEQEWHRPFDLARGPLMRVRVFRFAGDHHILLRTCHHIVSDAQSQRNFNRELRTLYEAFRAGRPNPLRALPVQYADFARDQQRWLDGPELAAGVAHWRHRLRGVPTLVSLPLDRSRSTAVSYDAADRREVVGHDVLRALTRLCRHDGATLYMTLLAAFAVLIARYAGQSDFVMVSAAAGRDARFEDLIGLFLNQLPLRMHADPRMRFRQLLAQVRQTTLDAYQHQEVPFDRIVEALQIRRQADAAPLLQIAFAYRDAQPPPLVPLADGLVMDVMPLQLRRVRGDLELQAQACDAGLSITWVYRAALFDEWRIAQMARDFERVVRAVAADPDRIVGQIELGEASREARPVQAGGVP